MNFKKNKKNSNNYDTLTKSSFKDINKLDNLVKNFS